MINDSQYVDLVVQIVQSTTSSGRDYITAAALGETLKRSVSDQSWRDFGYRTLSELLRSPPVEARLELFKTDKGALAVRPLQASVATGPAASREYNSLKQPIWGAFVMATPAGRRFLNRRTGAVRAGLQDPPVPLDEWAEITPISTETQKGWAREFLSLATFEVSEDMRAALHLPSWNHAFTTALGPHASEWKRYRSYKVAENANEWASTSGVSHDDVFQSRAEGPVASAALRVAQRPPSDDREVILAALATLPIEKLRDISLPAGVIVDAMRRR